RAARRRGAPVIIATQMLDSMTVNSQPTRAEASDVANGVYEGADALMLSGESAVGAFPIGAVTMMDAIIRRVEADPLWGDLMRAEHVEGVCGALRMAKALTRMWTHSSPPRPAPRRPGRRPVWSPTRPPARPPGGWPAS